MSTKKLNHAEETSSSAERIVEVAMVLFAEHGYHGVSTREIAAATGLSVATVHHHAVSKRDLYLKVFRSLQDTAEEFFRSTLAELAEADINDPVVRHNLPSTMVDRFVDMVHKNPVRARLFLRHWLDDSEELSDIESELTLPLFHKAAEMIQMGNEAGIVRVNVDPALFIRSIEWLVYGYFVSGGFDKKDWHSDPHHPEQLEAFKHLVREYLRQMLGI